MSNESALAAVEGGVSHRARASAFSPRIRLVDRHVLLAGLFVFTLPNMLFALCLAPWAALLVLVGVAGTLVLSSQGAARHGDALLSRPVALGRLTACLVAAFGLLVLGGEAHLAFANWDWLCRDAVLADLARAPFPPTYEVSGESFFLRAPLGMYMAPALVAKVAGLVAGDAALLVQNAVLLAAILYLLATLAGRRALVAVLVFVSFSGLDVLGHLVFWLRQGHGPFVLPSHLEGWIGLQYSSVITQLFWVPNHALPSYWLALLVLFCVRGEATLGEVGLAVAVTLFWSPFAVVGTLPFLVYLLVARWRKTVASSGFWMAVAAALCFLPVALYLRVDAGQVPREFLLFKPWMIFTIILFLVIEIPHVLLIRQCWAGLEAWLAGPCLVAVAVLVLLPTMRFGLANDLVMRASIPALTILAFVFAEALAVARATRRGLYIAGLALVIVGAATPAQEILRALRFPASRISDCNLITVWKKVAPNLPTFENYLARPSRLPSWLMSANAKEPLREHPSTVCWPDVAFVSIDAWNEESNATILQRSREASAPRL